MTDTDPLAPIEALADNWARGYPSLVIAPQLRAALAEAREAVDGLVAERNAARAEIQSAVLARNSAMRRQAEERLAKEGNIAALNAAVAERDGWEQRFRELQTESRALPCDGGCVEAPEEDCSRHGRTPADLWRIIDEVRAERDAAREALARVEALADALHCEWTNSPTCEETCCINGRVAALIAKHSILTAPVQPTTDEEAGQ